MTTPLVVLISRDASVHTRIECEAEELSSIRQGDVPVPHISDSPY